MAGVEAEHPPRVSVVMAVFQGERWLAQALDSVMGQTFTDWELILVDDASQDGSADIMTAYATREPRIKVVRNSVNFGLAASLNRAMSLARGTYLARMDADDVCLAERLARQVEFLDAHPDVCVLGGGADYVGDDGAIKARVLMPEDHDEIVATLPRRSPFIHPTVMVRRWFMEEMGGYDLRLRKKQDYDLWVRGARRCRYHNLPVSLVLYRHQKAKAPGTVVAAIMVRLRCGYRHGFLGRAMFWSVVELAVALARRLGYREAALRAKGGIGPSSGH